MKKPEDSLRQVFWAKILKCYFFSVFFPSQRSTPYYSLTFKLAPQSANAIISTTYKLNNLTKYIRVIIVSFFTNCIMFLEEFS